MAEIKYKTFQSLFDSVVGDLSLYDDNQLILPLRYIKTARTCNATLGLMLNKKREQVLEVENYRVDIPDDCLTILALAKHSQGCFNIPRPTTRCLPKFSSDSINRSRYDPNYQVDVDDRELMFNFTDSDISVYYLCHMEDEDGNLLILDHDLVNDYYEWSLKEKIFTDLWHNNDADVQQKLADARQQVPIHRQRAQRITSMPEYRKMKEHTRRMEQEHFDKFYKPIL